MGHYNAQYYSSHDNEGSDDEEMEGKKKAMSGLLDMLMNTKDQSNYQPDQGELDGGEGEGTGGKSEMSLMGDEAEGSPKTPPVNGGSESVLIAESEDDKLKKLSKRSK